MKKPDFTRFVTKHASEPASTNRRRRTGVNYLPLDTRIKLHHRVGELRGLGLSYAQILEVVLRRQHVRLSKSIISEWTRGIHSPNGRLNSFLANPTPELAYVIGVILSDGNLNIHGYSAELILAVTDYEFAREFSRCLGIVLQREHPYTVRWHARKNRWVIQGSSVLLYNFLHRDWRNLKKWIEHCEECTASFLKAFYDGEGCISGRRLTVANTDLELLFYARHAGTATSQPGRYEPCRSSYRENLQETQRLLSNGSTR